MPYTSSPPLSYMSFPGPSIIPVLVFSVTLTFTLTLVLFAGGTITGGGGGVNLVVVEDLTELEGKTALQTKGQLIYVESIDEAVRTGLFTMDQHLAGPFTDKNFWSINLERD